MEAAVCEIRILMWHKETFYEKVCFEAMHVIVKFASKSLDM